MTKRQGYDDASSAYFAMRAGTCMVPIEKRKNTNAGQVKGMGSRHRRETLALWLAARDPRTPWYAKAAAAGVVAYALSPIDLIPDFIPVLGHLDDVLIVPLGIWLTIQLIPEPLMVEFREAAKRLEAKPRSYAGALVVVSVWLVTMGLILWWAPLTMRE